MLVHQLPPKPAYLRVKIWRRLQGLGAVSVKNSVYVLPASTEAQEDFEWLLREIHEGGGEALVCEARIVDGMTDQDVRALFDQARDAEYEEIAKETRELATDLKRKPSEEVRSNVKNRLAKLRARFAQVHHRLLWRQRPRGGGRTAEGYRGAASKTRYACGGDSAGCKPR